MRVLYLLQTVGSPVWDWHLWGESDMDTFLKVARTILGGDLLVHQPYHPVHLWHRAIAPAEDWERWYAPHVFHQTPGYYYFLALLLKIFGGSLVAVRVFQSLLGAVHASLLGAIGRRIMGSTGGLVVGLFAALYGPFVAAEPMLLREGVGLLLATLGLYMVVRAFDHPLRALAESRWLSWLAAGAVFGIGALMKETGFILFAAVFAWVLGRGLWRRDRHLRLAAFALLAGFAVGLFPMVARNLAVGAPPLAFSPQGAVNFILANAADSPSRGVSFQKISPSVRSIMGESQGRLLPCILATLRTYHGRPGLLLVNLWAKFSAVWSNVEQPDNFNYEYVVMHSTLLHSLPRFVCVWLPAALGVMLLTGAWITRRRSPAGSPSVPSPGKPPRLSVPFPGHYLGLLLTILAVHALAQSFLLVMGRYRLVIVPFLMLAAGWLVTQALTWLLNRQWLTCGGTGVGVCALLLLWVVWPANPDLEEAARRPVDFGVGASILLARNDVAGARGEFERGLAYVRSHAASHQESQRSEIWLRRSRLLLFASYRRLDLDEVQTDWKILREILPHDRAIQEVQRRIFLDEDRMVPKAEKAPASK